MKKMIWFLVLGLPLVAQAEEVNFSNASGATSRFSWSDLASRSVAKYSALFLGPTTQSLDGNLDGKGTSLSVRHYPSLEYKIADLWSVDASGEFRQYWRPIDPKKPNRQEFEPRDPGVGISRKDIIKNRSETFALSARARYYVPVTTYNKTNVGSSLDAGHGASQFVVTPFFKFLDGALTLSIPSEFNYRFAKRAPVLREQYWLRARTMFSYKAFKNIACKLEYSTGERGHRSNGTWTKFNDPITGQRVQAGFQWDATKKLSLSPAISWGKPKFRLNQAEMSVFASYALL